MAPGEKADRSQSSLAAHRSRVQTLALTNSRLLLWKRFLPWRPGGHVWELPLLLHVRPRTAHFTTRPHTFVSPYKRALQSASGLQNPEGSGRGAVALPRIRKSGLSFGTPPAPSSCLRPTAAPGGSLGSASPTRRVPASPSSELR